MPVVRTDGRAVGRSVYGHVIAKFSRMGSLPHFLTHGAPLRTREIRYNRREVCDSDTLTRSGSCLVFWSTVLSSFCGIEKNQYLLWDDNRLLSRLCSFKTVKQLGVLNSN